MYFAQDKPSRAPAQRVCLKENGDKYAQVEHKVINETVDYVSTYESAPDSTIKEVILGISLTEAASELQKQLLHEHNPTGFQASWIGKARYIDIVFTRLKVPNHDLKGNLQKNCFYTASR
ncbi:hypothetical protein HPB48_010817 [Haemaphysalis longicornis]|uniref:Uncharacterized protein n=1 Tax=Haemaphysalis longicornis TaxID=44386 RepID=A0A9J6H0J5_HAELO|nr:hypothetical protein HPB48_010817 [Haemaphysalis longicornis]